MCKRSISKTIVIITKSQFLEICLNFLDMVLFMFFENIIFKVDLYIEVL